LKPKSVSQKVNKVNPDVEQSAPIGNEYALYWQDGGVVDAQKNADYAGNLMDVEKIAQEYANKEDSTVLVVRCGLGVQVKIERTVRPTTVTEA